LQNLKQEELMENSKMIEADFAVTSNNLVNLHLFFSVN